MFAQVIISYISRPVTGEGFDATFFHANWVLFVCGSRKGCSRFCAANIVLWCAAYAAYLL